MKKNPNLRQDDGNAFLRDVDGDGSGRAMLGTDAESFAEEFIGSATCAESVTEDAMDEVVDEEDGGPFLMLDDEARLPLHNDDGEIESSASGQLPIQSQERARGARWVARH